MAKFVLYFRGGWPRPEGQETFIAKFGQWIGHVGQSGKMLYGERLKPTGRIVSGSSGEGISDLQHGNDTTDGYIVVEVKNYEEAVSLSKECPLLEIGGKIEVREIHPTDQM